MIGSECSHALDQSDCRPFWTFCNKIFTDLPKIISILNNCFPQNYLLLFGSWNHIFKKVTLLNYDPKYCQWISWEDSLNLNILQMKTKEVEWSCNFSISAAVIKNSCCPVKYMGNLIKLMMFLINIFWCGTWDSREGVCMEKQAVWRFNNKTEWLEWSLPYRSTIAFW